MAKTVEQMIAALKALETMLPYMFEQTLDQAMEECVKIGEGVARSKIKVNHFGYEVYGRRNGSLKRQIIFTHKNKDKPIAKWLEWGTPSPIRSTRENGYLSFISSYTGKRIFKKEVSGQKPKLIFSTSYFKIKEAWHKVVRDKVEKPLDQLINKIIH